MVSPRHGFTDFFFVPQRHDEAVAPYSEISKVCTPGNSTSELVPRAVAMQVERVTSNTNPL